MLVTFHCRDAQQGTRGLQTEFGQQEVMGISSLLLPTAAAPFIACDD